MEEELLDHIASEPGAEYSIGNNTSTQVYINPFRDKFFKKIFASETSKEMLRSFLNGVLAGKRCIHTITYGKNEYPGEIESERSAAFDLVCTDIDGTTFLVEVQRVKQIYFKERSIFYASRLISDQAPTGNPDWEYNLKEIYVICLLADFSLPASAPENYLHSVTLNYRETGEPFYDKLQFIYLEIEKFKKEGGELSTILDQWIYSMKHAEKMNTVPAFLNAPGLDKFFYLAKYSNLTEEEREMYRTKEQVGWDNRNTANFAGGKKEGLVEGALTEKKEIAQEMKQDGINIDRIMKYTKLSKEQIEVL
jgi:predicted transposase/invertase (TIGR01784 family)